MLNILFQIFWGMTNTAIELMGAQLIFMPVLTKRNHFWWRFVLSTILFMGLSYGLSYATYPLLSPSENGEIDMKSLCILMTCSIAVFFIYVGFNLLCYKDRWSTIMLSSSLSYLIFHISYCLVQILVAIYDDSSFQALLNVSDGVFNYVKMARVILFDIVIYTISFFVIRANAKRMDFSNTPPSFALFITFLTIVVGIVLSGNIISWARERNATILSRTVETILSITVVAMGIIFPKSVQLVAENSMMKYIMDNDKKQYEISKQSMDIINMKSHDLKQQLHSLELTRDDRDELMDKIDKAIESYDSVVKTGNKTLDIIITEKNLTFKRDDVHLFAMCDGSLLNFMKGYDIYSLFGNILQNAYEGVMKLDASKRVINLNVSQRQNLLIIHEENPCGDDVCLIDGKLSTSKQDRYNHGFGTKSMKYVVEQYEGSISFSVDTNMFYVDIIIPLP